MDSELLCRNISGRSLEEMAPYVNKAVAWSLDGSKILASGATYDELFDEIDRLGLKPMEYIIGFWPDPNVSYF